MTHLTAACAMIAFMSDAGPSSEAWVHLLPLGTFTARKPMACPRRLPAGSSGSRHGRTASGARSNGRRQRPRRSNSGNTAIFLLSSITLGHSGRNERQEQAAYSCRKSFALERYLTLFRKPATKFGFCGSWRQNSGTSRQATLTKKIRYLSL
jgi:hypothetical protein